MKGYKEFQYGHQVEVVKEHPDWFDNDKLNGKFKGNSHEFILQDGKNNLFSDLRGTDAEDHMNVMEYFRANKIGWWSGNRPTGHLCSSQISCLNHLYPLRYDAKAVLAIVNTVVGEGFFDSVIEVGGDRKFPAYIAFEVVTSRDYLNESKNGQLSRGSQCTSVDAVILAKRREKVWLFPIEWKFVERYGREDKSGISFDRKLRKWNLKGNERIFRYFTKPESSLVPNSKQIIYDGKDPHRSVFFQEPYYQLLRQTLWAEQVIINQDSFFKGAGDYVHVHVVPDADGDLLEHKYENATWEHGAGMVSTWKSCLVQPEKYHCIDPKSLYLGILSDESLAGKYSRLIQYLEARYW